MFEYHVSNLNDKKFLKWFRKHTREYLKRHGESIRVGGKSYTLPIHMMKRMSEGSCPFYWRIWIVGMSYRFQRRFGLAGEYYSMHRNGLMDQMIDVIKQEGGLIG